MFLGNDGLYYYYYYYYYLTIFYFILFFLISNFVKIYLAIIYFLYGTKVPAGRSGS